MPASSHYKAKGRPTVRKAVTALKRAIARRGRGVTTMPYLGSGVTTMPYLGSGRRGRRGGFIPGLSWKQMEDAFNSIPAAINAIPQGIGLIPNSSVINWLK
jgi:hypothetical protein